MGIPYLFDQYLMHWQLTSYFLLKCFHGETQNPNEAFNNICWTGCSKNVYVSRLIMEMGVNSAVLHYNEGACGIINECIVVF